MPPRPGSPDEPWAPIPKRILDQVIKGKMTKYLRLEVWIWMHLGRRRGRSFEPGKVVGLTTETIKTVTGVTDKANAHRLRRLVVARLGLIPGDADGIYVQAQHDPPGNTVQSGAATPSRDTPKGMDLEDLSWVGGAQGRQPSAPGGDAFDDTDSGLKPNAGVAFNDPAIIHTEEQDQEEERVRNAGPSAPCAAAPSAEGNREQDPGIPPTTRIPGITVTPSNEYPGFMCDVLNSDTDVAGYMARLNIANLSHEGEPGIPGCNQVAPVPQEDPARMTAVASGQGEVLEIPFEISPTKPGALVLDLETGIMVLYSTTTSSEVHPDLARATTAAPSPQDLDIGSPIVPATTSGAEPIPGTPPPAAQSTPDELSPAARSAFKILTNYNLIVSGMRSDKFPTVSAASAQGRAVLNTLTRRLETEPNVYGEYNSLITALPFQPFLQGEGHSRDHLVWDLQVIAGLKADKLKSMAENARSRMTKSAARGRPHNPSPPRAVAEVTKVPAPPSLSTLAALAAALGE